MTHARPLAGMTYHRPLAGTTYSDPRAGTTYARGMAVLLALLLALVASVAQAAPAFPPLTGRVTDAAGVLPADAAASLDAKLAALETATGTQLVVATVPSLGDYPIEDYGYQLGRAWGIGQKGTNNGAILLVAPNERKVRIEIGYGLEDRLTDALSETIIRRDIIPSFKAGDMAGGIVRGTDALLAQLQATPEQARANLAAAAQPRQRARGDGPGFGAWLWIGIIFLWLFFSVFRGQRGRRSSGLGSAILWGVASGMLNNRGGGGGGWGGGGGGGGGFSGGGGSFGGGGASGSW